MALFVVPSNFGAIHTITTHHSILSYVDEETLVVFDIDETIMYLRSLFYHPHARIVRSRLHRVIGSDKESDMLFGILFKNIELSLLESDFPELFKKIKEKAAGTMACTSRSSGFIGKLSATQHVFEQLKEFGIVFKAMNQPSFVILKDSSCEKKERCDPEVYHDILFTQGRDKGPALILFFQQTGLWPKKVIFVDDLEKNIHSVKDTLSSHGIPCTCFHYTRSPVYKIWNEELVQFQVSHLLKYHEWLSDDEALKLLNHVMERKHEDIL